MDFQTLNFWLGNLATIAFAITAVLAVNEKDDIDIFAVVVLGGITAVGGGTLRDLMIGEPVFWLPDATEIRLAVLASACVFIAKPLFRINKVYLLMLYLDAFGAALFAVQGTLKVWEFGYTVPILPLIFGVMSAIGGGVIRDVIAERKTLLMSSELYIIPVLLGCVSMVAVLKSFPEHALIGEVLCSAQIFLFRACAIHWNLSVPNFLVLRSKK
ncbi:trimeric intracellular cation channel family protein [Polynucleobacter necessarius]|uniref:trimeric intracellular cation channel family protein n=1 Tax=Polynucleobacter necessarius TaxID=576610 RepID=UPI0013B06ABB|nr:TRIC cation channel family protein [Polynucleobacter necessarius]